MSTDAPIFQVSRLNAFGTRLLERHAATLKRLGDLESRVLAGRIAATDTAQPIYVCGLARSGTTILLELLDRHAATASHRYQDYLGVFTPYVWGRYLEQAHRSPGPAAERAHRDGLKVTPDSPEAMEEPIWMHFFPGAHDPADSNLLTAETRNPAFEAFYDAHLAKLLLMRGGSRYLCKGNYHLARIGYLAALYPEARFIVPVSDPAAQIASSMRQHALFSEGQQQSPAARRYLRQVGHFEFGRDRAPINVAPGRTEEVRARWQAGDELGGWTAYWASIHDHLDDLLQHDPGLRRRIQIVPYETLCAAPATMAEQLRDFCGLPEDSAFAAFAADAIAPARSSPPERFTADELARIRRDTADVVERLLAWAEVPADAARPRKTGAASA